MLNSAIFTPGQKKLFSEVLSVLADPENVSRITNELTGKVDAFFADMVASKETALSFVKEEFPAECMDWYLNQGGPTP